MCVVAYLRSQIWSWGIGDNGVLGRVVNDPSKGTTEELETTPHPITVLTDENFRAVRVAAGDSISLAISDQGELRAWGSFRVSMCLGVFRGMLTFPTVERRPARLRRHAWLSPNPILTNKSACV